jgi:uncharacterized membrane protein
MSLAESLRRNAAWVVLMAALVAAGGYVPVMPWIGGGGYTSLSYFIGGLCGFVLGPYVGFITGLLGTILGWLINPASAPTPDSFIDTAALMALTCGLLAKGKWKEAAAFYAIVNIVFCYVLMPFYIIPKFYGLAQFVTPSQVPLMYGENYMAFVMPLVALVLGRFSLKAMRGSDERKRFVGVLIASIGGTGLWFPLWSGMGLIEFFVFYPMELLLLAWGILYVWWTWLFAVIVAAITVPLLEALKRSGIGLPTPAVEYAAATVK